MVGIFKRIYDWLLSLFWYELPNSLHVSHLITQIQSLLGVCVCACVHVCLCVGGEPCSLMFTPLWLHIDDNDNDDDDDDDNVHSNIILTPAQYQCTGLAVELG